jgi:recombination protein RecA
MGDAKRHSIDSSVGFNHGTDQQDYLLWKHSELRNIVSEKALTQREYIDKRSGSKLIDGRFYTLANSDVEKINKEFYANGDKQITQDILDNLSPLSLAVWYMDDGHTEWYQRHRDRGVNTTADFMICTESFSKVSCDMMYRWLLRKYGLECRLKERKNANFQVIGKD